MLWRIALFYIINLLIVGLNVPYTDPQLLGSGSSADSAGVDTKASPFVLAIQNAGIKVLPSIINAVVLISSLSVANSCIYASTRTVQALAMTSYAPDFMAYIDKQGRPLGPIILQILFGFIAYIQLASSGLAVFNWLLSIGSLSATLMYFSINLAHIRFRQAFNVQGRSTDDIPWKSPLGIWGSIVGVILALICLAAVFYSSLLVSLLILIKSPSSIAIKNWPLLRSIQNTPGKRSADILLTLGSWRCRSNRLYFLRRVPLCLYLFVLLYCIQGLESRMVARSPSSSN